MFGELIAGKGQERQFNGRHKDWLRCLSENMKAFGIESEGWTTRARDEVEWHRCVEQGAKRFFADWSRVCVKSISVHVTPKIEKTRVATGTPYIKRLRGMFRNVGYPHFGTSQNT